MHRCASIVLVFLAVLAPRAARADDIDAARRLFAEGVKLFQRGDFEGSRRLFRRADAEHHAPAIVYNIGLAEERSGHPQAAMDAYEAYVLEGGDHGEYTPAAVMAIAQIKARTTRLRIETRPAGARLFVDASILSEPSPTTFLVSAGHHIVVAQGDSWRAEQDFEARGGGEITTIVLDAPPPTAPAAIAQAPVDPVATAPAPPPPAPIDRAPAAPETRGPEGLVWGASFALTPYHLTRATQAGAANSEGATQAIAGAIVEAGYALSDRFELLGRGFAAFGPNGGPTTAWGVGPAVSYRLGSFFWLGATFIGGQLETRANGVRYGTDLVYGAMVETALAILTTSAGQWTVGTQPGVLLTDDPKDNTAYFVSLTFGFRAY